MTRVICPTSSLLLEFKTFCARVPKHYRAKLKENQEAKFKEIAGDDGIIQHDELIGFFKDLVASCANPEEVV